jgi:hypothetical protein
MPQEIGGNNFRRNEKKNLKHQERARLQGRKKTCSEFGLWWTTCLGVVATIGASERWIASRCLVHRIASR